MSDLSAPSHFRVLLEDAFQKYETQTGTTLADHPLAEELQNCDSVDSVTAVFREQTEALGKIQENDKVFKPLKKVLSALHKLSSASAVDGLVRPQAPIGFQCH